MGGQTVRFGARGFVIQGTIYNNTTLYYKADGYTTFMAGQAISFRPVDAVRAGGFVTNGVLLNNTTLYYGPGRYRTYQGGSRVSFNADGYVI